MLGLILPGETRLLAAPAGPQGAVFGCAATQRVIVFVVHITRPQSAERVKWEMLQAIDGLKPFYLFRVIGTDHKGRPTRLWHGELVQASPENKRVARQFIQEMGLTQDQSLLSMVDFAFFDKPTLGYLVTDALRLDPALGQRLDDATKGVDIRVNSILVLNRAPNVEQILQAVANGHRGKYRYFGQED